MIGSYSLFNFNKVSKGLAKYPIPKMQKLLESESESNFHWGEIGSEFIGLFGIRELDLVFFGHFWISLFLSRIK